MEGSYERFHENGVMASKGQVKDNEQDGEWQYFDELGNLTETRIYSNGAIKE
jgi:antitoxin component YwqK of YwqJK toxin-antitoxin module